MKKVLFIILCLFFICGCDNKIEKFYLNDEYYNKYELIDITSDEFNELENNKKTFAILVYSNGCSSCSKFQSILNKYLEKNSLTFYSISYSDCKNTNIKSCIKFAPTLMIYKDGELVTFLDANSDDDLEYYESVDGFNKWFTKYVILK